MLTIWNINFSCGHLRTMNPSPYWVTAGRGSPTSRAPLKVGTWCTQTRLTASAPHRYDNIYLYVDIVYMSSIFSLINKCQKFVGYLAAIRDRWGASYGSKRNLQGRPRSMDGRASTHLLLHSGVALACPCGALVWQAADCCRATRGNESEFAQVSPLQCLVCFIGNLSGFDINLWFILWTG
jgi:hypothetical protein